MAERVRNFAKVAAVLLFLALRRVRPGQPARVVDSTTLHHTVALKFSKKIGTYLAHVFLDRGT